MEENKLFEILDPRVLREGSKEEIEVVAELSRRCLHLNGKKRPTMKEVAVELEGIQMMKEGSVYAYQNGKRENHTIVVDHDSYDFSTISGSMHSETDTTYFANAQCPLLHEP
ncbi:wall-associated receptor kinase-like 8 [Phtheirospermum japonicum]|uniref:Wall-associated receptor kinase-like 8 n=2 Tax=Phtheirospermum japonicum TaxID=374723 RepID=A0A830DJF4_9LAMI|nr:wall-associated receptor kinase-like 8 [Phtheirospermum japonicum]